MASTESRLEVLKAKSEKRLYKKTVYDAGFDHADDYEAWKLLNDLRDLTFKERKASAGIDASQRASLTGWNDGTRTYTFNAGPFTV